MWISPTCPFLQQLQAADYKKQPWLCLQENTTREKQCYAQTVCSAQSTLLRTGCQPDAKQSEYIMATKLKSLQTLEWQLGLSSPPGTHSPDCVDPSVLDVGAPECVTIPRAGTHWAAGHTGQQDMGKLMYLRQAQVSVARAQRPQLTNPHRPCQSSFHTSPELLYLENISNSLKEAVRVSVTQGTFGRATSFPFEVWCLSTFPFLCPWQSTHTCTVSCPQNTQLQFMSTHPFLYAEYPFHLNRRIIGVGGSLAQTIAVIKPCVHE